MNDHWKNTVLKAAPQLTEFESTGIYTAEMEKNLGIEYHDKMSTGSILRTLRDQKFHLSYWETPYYEKAINGFIEGVENPEGKLAIDIGCGDGRFTELLLDRGYNVIALDAHIQPLFDLAQYAEKNGLTDRLMVIHCSADSLPIPDGLVDVALAIGVFYYLNENFEKALGEAHRVLKSGGVLVNSEPDIEGATYKSVILDEIEDLLENLEERRFKEGKGKTEFKFRLFTKDDMKGHLEAAGFEFLDYHGLSLLPSILRIKTSRGEFSLEELEEKEDQVRNVFDYFDANGSLHKHVIWNSRKR